MNEALSALTGHYEKLRGQKYTVPGVLKADGKPLVVYYDPPTQAQGQKIRARAGISDEGKVSLYTVIYLAKDADGNRMFEDDADTVQALTEQVGGTILGGIARAIMSVSKVADLGNS